MREVILRINAPHFCAGAVFQIRDGQWVCVETAPIIKWMRGWTGQKAKQYCGKKGWEYQAIPSFMERVSQDRQ